MSPLQTGTLISGVVFTATKTMCTVMELVAHRDLVPSNIGVLITMGCTISWIGFFSALNCERILTRLDQRDAALRKDIVGFGELCTEDGRLDAARDYARVAGGPAVMAQRGRLNLVD